MATKKAAGPSARPGTSYVRKKKKLPVTGVTTASPKGLRLLQGNLLSVGTEGRNTTEEEED